ncbi:MAG: hypothetical protein GY847_06130 [Proteobacteria bacterium]|nr:hypothetical protein [Pseudomonadota bacterium]
METCRHCGGKMRMVAAITNTASIKKYLDGVGESIEIPVLKPARPPPQTELEDLAIGWATADEEWDYDEGA